jgi:hypothetical protein
MTDGTGDRKRFPAAVNAETSPGRAEYDAHQRAEASQLRSEQARAMSIAGKGWEALAAYERRSWDAAAIAAVDHVAAKVWPELTAERDELRELLAEILTEFGNSSGDGYRARVGQVKYAGWKRRAGMEEG